MTEIGENAFAGCSGLTSVNILCDVGLLPEGAFAVAQILPKQLWQQEVFLQDFLKDQHLPH